jgi:hypothetical protein
MQEYYHEVPEFLPLPFEGTEAGVYYFLFNYPISINGTTHTKVHSLRLCIIFFSSWGVVDKPFHSPAVLALAFISSVHGSGL